jgi:flagellar motility protein MotE (MotC chaperone)
MKLLQNPFVVAALGLIIGLGTGMQAFWRAAKVLAAEAVQARAHVVVKAGPEAPWGFWSLEMENIVSDLRDEKLQLAKREELVDQREARFAAERAELENVRKDLEAMRVEISQKVIEITADESKNLRTLAQTYAVLTPKGAVTIFKQMDDVTVVKILSLMKADVVGPIFEEFGKESAASPELARRASVLSEKLRLMKSTRTASSP